MLSRRCCGSSSKATAAARRLLPCPSTTPQWRWQRPPAMPLRRGMRCKAAASTSTRTSNADSNGSGNGRKAPPPAQPAVEQEEQEEADPTRYPVDIFAALAPHSMGRGRQLALLAAGAAAEFALLGSLVWAPLLWALAIVASTPSLSEQHRREAALVDRAVARARAELLGRVPITPVENAWWLERVNGALWQPFVEPMLLQQNLTQWQDNLSAAAPKGWDVEIADLSLGTTAPRLSSFQAFGQQPSGMLVAVDCRLAWDTDSVRIVVRGKGPLGKFVARVSALQLEGELRLTPVLDQRMLLWAFKTPPSVSVRLAVQGPIGPAAYDVSQFSFIQDLLSSTIQETLVEPRRGAVSLDYDMRVEEAIATTINVTVETVRGIPRSAATGSTRRSPPRISVTAYVAMSRAKRSTATHTLAAGSRSVDVRESLELDLTSREGIVRLEARDSSRGGALVGTACLWAAAARDGSTLLWSSDRQGSPLAQRWRVGQRPWRVTLPLEGNAAAEVDVGVSVDPWIYKQAPAASAYRSVGPRTVVLQIVEARQLAKPGATAIVAPYIVLQYDQMTYATPPVFDTPNPVWLRTFTFDENASLLTRRVRLEAWSQRRGATGSSAAGSARSDELRLERLGNAVINLDLATEDVVQDRWVPLNGSDGGEVRVRLAIVPGEKTASPAREATQLLDTTLCSSSSPSISAEVLSARLYLPLSSLDSQDGDSAAWMDIRLSHGGASATGGGRSDAGSGGEEGESSGRSGVRVMTDAAVDASNSRAHAMDGSYAAGAEISVRSGCLARAAFALDAANPALKIECRDTGMFGNSVSSLSSLSGEDEDCCAAVMDVLAKLRGGDAWEGWVQLDKDAGQVLLRLTLHQAAEPTDTPIGATPAETAAAAPADARSRGSSPSGRSSKGSEAALKLREKGGGDGTRPEVVALEALLSETTKQASKVGYQVQELSQHAASNLTSWLGQLNSTLSSSSNGSDKDGSSSSNTVNQLFDPSRLLPPAGATTGAAAAHGGTDSSNGSKGSGVGGLLTSLQQQPLVANSTANLQKVMQSGWLGGLGRKVAHGAKEVLPSSITGKGVGDSDTASSSSPAVNSADDAGLAAAGAYAAKQSPSSGSIGSIGSGGSGGSGSGGSSSSSSTSGSPGVPGTASTSHQPVNQPMPSTSGVNGRPPVHAAPSLGMGNGSSNSSSGSGSRSSDNGGTPLAPVATTGVLHQAHAAELSTQGSQRHGSNDHSPSNGIGGGVPGTHVLATAASPSISAAVSTPGSSEASRAAVVPNTGAGHAADASAAASRAATALASHPLQDGSIDDWYDEGEYDF